MNSIYIASTTAYSGKTAVALGIGLHARGRRQRVGYFKPLSIHGYRPNDIHGDADQDALFAQRVFGLSNIDVDQIAPVRMNDAMLEQLRDDAISIDMLWQRITDAYATIQQDRDLMLIEGSGTLRDGFALGIHIRSVPERLDLPVLIVSGWRALTLTLDDIIAAQELLGDRLLGVILNSVPDDSREHIDNTLKPLLDKRNITLYGTLPLQPQLRAISIGEVVSILDAAILVGDSQQHRLIEAFSVGAMSVESAIPILRAATNTAVITGADRSDMQGAALESESVACLILTGEVQPHENILQRAEQQSIAVLSVTDATMQALEKIEQVFGKTPMGQAEKLNRFQAVLAQHLDYDRLFNDIEGN